MYITFFTVCLTQSDDPDSTPLPPQMFLKQAVHPLGAALKGQFTSTELPHEPLHLCLVGSCQVHLVQLTDEVTLNGMIGMIGLFFLPFTSFTKFVKINQNYQNSLS